MLLKLARRWLVLATILLLASPTMAEFNLRDDPEGDVVYIINGQQVDSLTEQDEVDLLFAGVGGETPTELQFAARTVAPSETELAGLDTSPRTISWSFRVQEARYELRENGGQCGAGKALLSREEPVRMQIQCVELEPVDAGAELRAHVPKHLLVDERGFPLLAGAVVGDVWAWADRGALAGPPAYDEAGRDDPLAWVLQGATAAGDIPLTTPAPLRHSNGEPAAYTFPIRLVNPFDDRSLIHLSLDGLPAGWEGRVTPAVELDPQEGAEFPLIVVSSSSHKHGESVEFQLVATAAEEEAETVLDLGVRFLDLPQPTGHHRTVYLHAQEGKGWMNTLQDDERADGGDVLPSQRTIYGPGEFMWPIEFPLDPALMVSLRTQGDLPASAQATLTSRLPGSFDIRGGLWLCTAEGEQVDGYCQPHGRGLLLAEGWTRGTDTLSGPAPFSIDLVSTGDRDLVYDPDTNLALAFEVWSTQSSPAAAGGVSVETAGAEAMLPFADLEDALEQIDYGQLALRFEATRVEARPGERAWFVGTVANAGAAGALSVEVLGDRSGIFAVQTPTDFEIRHEDAAQIVLVADIPEETPAGGTFEALIVVSRQDDATSVAVGKLRAVANPDAALAVTPEFDAPVQKESPAPMGLALLAAALWMAHRRR